MRGLRLEVGRPVWGERRAGGPLGSGVVGVIGVIGIVASRGGRGGWQRGRRGDSALGASGQVSGRDEAPGVGPGRAWGRGTRTPGADAAVCFRWG